MNKIISVLVLVIATLSIINVVQYISVVEPVVLKEFNSVGELEIWLLGNDIDTNTYIVDTYDCDDFSIDMVNDAWQDGYLIYSMGSGTVWYKDTIMYDDDTDTAYWGIELIDFINHAYCITRINGIWYMIEPQNDEITELGIEF